MKGGINLRIRNKAQLIRSMAILVFLFIGVVNISVANTNKKEAEYIDYTITKGETLWSIAREYTPDNKDIRQTIYEIKQINNMQTSNVYENQTIKIKIGQ